MASTLVSSILSKASQVLGFAQRSAVSSSSSSDPRSSILKDLKELEKTLKWIQAVLRDAEEREIRDESVKLWLKDLKEVAYRADNVLDEYQYEVLRAQVEGRSSRKRKRVEGDDEQEVSIPDSLGDRIRQIREDFDKISKLREQLQLREEDGERRVLEAPYPAPTSHMVDESSIYGREHDKQEVIDLLFSEGVGNGVSVIPIVGKGGLGKTTIAQLVYSDPKVKQYFNLTGWVCVSDDFDVPRLTKAIIESLTRSPCDLTQLSTLQDALNEKVKGKKVLLVLDDVWNEQQSHWESLRNPFIGAETVTIIMTCRNDSVAEIMKTVRPYHPDYLSPEQSWSLFRHYAFGGRDPEEQLCLVDMGKQIVKKCSGLPLALKSIGSLLRYTTDEDSWMDIVQSDIWEVDENNKILPALRLSYSRMPAHLKPCFIYSSMFPKDYAFDKDVLVRLWMAQGYIPYGGRRSIEDIGDEYFNDLQRRSFFDSYRSKFFKMHDMIHDLAKSIAGNECYAIVDKKLPNSPDEVRHLYVQDEDGFVKSLHSYDFSALRTLLLWDYHLFAYQTRIQKVIKYLPQLRCLRTLEFCWDQADEMPDFLSNMKHLRRLFITSKYMKKLPESVCLLYHLQTLVLNCPDLEELPDSLSNLTNLSCLNTWGAEKIGIIAFPNRNSRIVYLPAGIIKLPNLRSLVGCFKVQGGIGVLKDLVNLQGCLRISGLRNLVNIEDAKDVGLKYRPKLEELRLRWIDGSGEYTGMHLHLVEASPKDNKVVLAEEKRDEAMLEYLQPHTNLKKLHIEQYPGSKFPKWVGNPFSLASLQEIYISYCEKITSLPLYIYDSLGKLGAPITKSMLERVYIRCCPQLTSIAGLHNLHLLKVLDIYSCPQLRLLSEEGLPSKLERLHIEECQELTSLPGMQNLTSLQALNIKNNPQLRLLLVGGSTSKLENLHIEECQRLTSLPRMQNLTSVEELTIKNYQLRFLSCEGLPFDLRNLHIEECLQLTSFSRMRNFFFLQELYIQNCPQLQFLSGKGLPGYVKNLHIEECQQLTSLLGMQYFSCLKELHIKNCSKLQIMAEDRLLDNLEFVEIVDCPGLSNWCQIQNINCIQVTSGNKLTISDTWENIMHGFDDLTSVEHLYFSSHWNSFLEEDSIPVLEELTIWSCTHIPPLKYLPKLTSLRSLVIKDCPRILFLPCELIPSTLKSLVVDSCEDLMFLPLAQQNRDALEVLLLVNCPKLILVQGLNCLFSPDFLIIERCPRLRLPQHHRQPSIPPCVEITEETEDEETSDDDPGETSVGLYGY